MSYLGAGFGQTPEKYCPLETKSGDYKSLNEISFSLCNMPRGLKLLHSRFISVIKFKCEQ